MSTGLTVGEFNELCTHIENQYLKHEAKRLGRKDKKRTIGAGSPLKLDLVDRLLIFLVYYRKPVCFNTGIRNL